MKKFKIKNSRLRRNFGGLSSNIFSSKKIGEIILFNRQDLYRSCLLNGAGFTLIEILLVMGVFSIIAGLGLFASLDFYKSYVFNSERDSLISSIERARNQSLANIDQSNHGLKIDQSTFTIFEGSSYASRDSSFDEIISGNSNVAKSGLSEIVFIQLSGESNASGSAILKDARRTAAVSVNYEGQIEW